MVPRSLRINLVHYKYPWHIFLLFVFCNRQILLLISIEHVEDPMLTIFYLFIWTIPPIACKTMGGQRPIFVSSLEVYVIKQKENSKC